MIEFVKKIENNVKKNGQKVAYSIKNESLTYNELWNNASFYASYLKKQGNAPVILYGHKSINMIISIIACILAKRAYIPVDLCTPKSRIKKIIALSKASLLITNEEISVDFIENCSLEELTKYGNNNNYKIDNDIAYIIFTSGSTGNPKGVPISYSNLDNFCKWIGNIEPLNSYKNINVLNQASFSFDLSVADFYYSLCYGHTLIGLDRCMQEKYDDIFEVIKDNEVNLMIITPTFIKLCLLNKDFNNKNFDKLKCIYFCGELLETITVQKIFERFPNIKIINAYGPTEATSAVSSIMITREMLGYDLLPVGDMKKLATEVEIVNKEIVLKGASVFNGYLGNIEGGHYKKDGINCYHTGDIGYIENNMLYCKGRADNQIKYKGYRIELFDIENNLKELNGVLDAVVVAKKNENGVVKLIKAFVILKIGYDIEKIKKDLAKVIPHYMMPKYLKKLDEFPVNNNGKIDRKKLVDE